MLTRAFLLVACLVPCMACTTIVRPTRPSSPLVSDGAPVTDLRFDGDEIQIREPGMPLSPSRNWQREVANYAAGALNEALSTEELAPTVKTIVTFDLASPTALQIGPWKEMTIGMTSTLPDGTVVKSKPVVGPIDDVVEYGVVTGMGIGGTVLDVTAGAASIFFIFSPSFVTGAVFLGALVGGLALNVGQTGAQYVFALNEEVRWSDLFATALRAHAADVRAQRGRGPPLRSAPSPPSRAPSSTTSTPALPDPADPSTPPPLLDPAEADDR
jgi:hypothetical protein